jgi:hypothetical protein
VDRHYSGNSGINYYATFKSVFFGDCPSGPRFPLYLFFKKDAAAIANPALRSNKVRRFRPGFRCKSQPPACRPVSRTLRYLANTSPVCSSGTCLTPAGKPLHSFAPVNSAHAFQQFSRPTAKACGRISHPAHPNLTEPLRLTANSSRPSAPRQLPDPPPLS